MSDQKNIEVNPEDIDTEVANVEETETTEETVDEGEKETQSETSTEEQPKESEETGEETPVEEGEPERLLDQPKENNQPKRLSTETPREYALRLEVTRLRAANRKDKSAEIFKNTDNVAENIDTLTEEDNKFLATYNKEELDNFEKVLSVMAKKNGWVKKGELTATTYQDRGQEILDTFLEEHPEYSADNDPNGVLWTQFKEEYALYKHPNNPKDLKKIFNKIHRDIFEVLPEEGLNKINAQKEKLKVASHSGATSNRNAPSPRQSTLDPSLKQHFKGFGDDELEDMFGV